MSAFPRNAARRIAHPLKRVREHGELVWSVYSTPIWVHEHTNPRHREPYVKRENRQKLADRSVTVHRVAAPWVRAKSRNTR
jgi:hypothetical protein